MNRKDFYKELMSGYTFDSDKIKENAKKGRFARQKISPVIGLTAAVAVSTVAFGTLAVNMLNSGGSNGVDLIDSGISTADSGAERLRRALEMQEQERANQDMCDVLVSFAGELTSAQVKDVLTQYIPDGEDSIPVRAVYFSDGSVLIGEREVGAVFSDGEDGIVGVAVNCAGSVMALLQQDPAIALAERMSPDDYNNIQPFSPDDVETGEVLPPDIGANVPVNPVVPGPDNNSRNDETEDIIIGGTIEPDDESSDYFFTESEETDEQDSQTEEIDESGEPSANEGQNTESEEPGVPAVQPSEAETMPDGVTLPKNVDKLSCETYIGADTAYFISDNVFFVKSYTGIALYRFDGTDAYELAYAPCSDAKVCWIAENGGRMIVSGTDENGRRNRLLHVSAENGEITDLHAEDTVMDGVIAGVGYNAEDNLLVINIREYGKYYICTAKVSLSGSADYIETIFESEAKISLMCSYNGTVYVAAADGQLTQVYAVSASTGEKRLVKSFDYGVSISKNLAFTHAVFTPAEIAVIGQVQIFDPATERFIITEHSSDSSVTFGVSRHNYTADGSYFTISGGTSESSGGVGVIAGIDYRRSLSSKYAAAVGNSGTVKITDSVYTKRSRTELLTFSEITEKADVSLRSAINGAIGVNNALALGRCEESGITKPETAKQSISAYYSENAAAQLMAKCGISELGALRYSAGGLTGISVSDTVLVVNNADSGSASGVLYIRAGSFNGKTAYRSVNVSFVYENGSWKLDSLLG